MIRSLFKDTAVYGMGDLVFKLVAFAVVPIYTHVFTVDEFGVMALIVSLAGLIGTFATLGMNNSVQRFYWDSKERGSNPKTIVSMGLGILILWSLALIAVVILGGYLVRDVLWQRLGLQWIWVILALAGILPFQIMVYAQDVLRIHFSPWKYTFVSACRNFFGVGLGLFFILSLSWGLTGYFWGMFWALWITAPIAVWLIRKDLVWDLNREEGKKLIQFGYPFIFAGLAYWIFTASDRWMLGVLADTTQVGYYSVAFYMMSIVFFVNQAFGAAWSPVAFKIYSEDPRYREIFGRILSYWLLGLVLLSGGITLFSEELLALLTPSEYWGAAGFVGFLMMGAVFYGTTQITPIGISLEKKTQLISRASWITAGINIALNFLLIPRMGAMGAALATCISYACLTGLYLFWTQKLHPILLESKKIVWSILIFLLLVTPFPFYRLGSEVSIFFSKLVFCAMIIALTFALDLIKVADIRKLRDRQTV